MGAAIGRGEGIFEADAKSAPLPRRMGKAIVLARTEGADHPVGGVRHRGKEGRKIVRRRDLPGRIAAEDEKDAVLAGPHEAARHPVLQKRDILDIVENMLDARSLVFAQGIDAGREGHVAGGFAHRDRGPIWPDFFEALVLGRDVVDPGGLRGDLKGETRNLGGDLGQRLAVSPGIEGMLTGIVAHMKMQGVSAGGVAILRRPDDLGERDRQSGMIRLAAPGAVGRDHDEGGRHGVSALHPLAFGIEQRPDGDGRRKARAGDVDLDPRSVRDGLLAETDRHRLADPKAEGAGGRLADDAVVQIDRLMAERDGGLVVEGQRNDARADAFGPLRRQREGQDRGRFRAASRRRRVRDPWHNSPSRCAWRFGQKARRAWHPLRRARRRVSSRLPSCR